MTDAPIVYLVDDDTPLRLASSTTLRMAGYEVKDYPSAESFLTDIGPDAAGCLVTDLLLPGMSGIAMQQALNSRRIKLPVIFITGYGDINESVQAMKRGAVNFLEKPVSPQVLISNVNEAMLLDAVRQQQEAARRVFQLRFERLTPREQEVTSMVASGKTNKEIALALNISYRTVEKYRAGAMVKLKVDNTVELIKLVQSQIPTATS